MKNQQLEDMVTIGEGNEFYEKKCIYNLMNRIIK